MKNKSKSQNKAKSKNASCKKPAVAKPTAGKKTKPAKQSPKRKNVSQTIPNGRIVRTRDEFFEGQGNYRKEGYEKKGLYRGAVVVDSNRSNELALIKLTTSKSGKPITDYKTGKSRYRPYIETKDDTGAPIKLGAKFIPDKPKKDLTKKQANTMKKEAVKKKKNRQKLHVLKGRK